MSLGKPIALQSVAALLNAALALMPGNLVAPFNWVVVGFCIGLITAAVMEETAL